MKPEVFLNSLVNYEKVPGYKYDLAAYRKFLQKVGSPHKKLRNVILVAGTKGKGSTAAIINSCLIAHGYRVGLYTSPHLEKINERIRINNRDISNRELSEYIGIIKPYVDFKNRVGARTFFEVLTAVAFLHFADHDLDFVILEVGLGGRLDATNVATPMISVITKIGYDHMNMLGNRLSQIAYEKAGIIRAHHSVRESNISRSLRESETNEAISNEIATRPLVARNDGIEQNPAVITIHQRPVVEKILRKVARKRKHEIIFADDVHRIKVLRMDMTGTDVHIKGRRGEFDAYLPLAGKHQVENLSLALAVLSRLRDQGIEINVPAVKAGITYTELHGRFEVISKKPLVIYDVAHNEDSFRALEGDLELLRTPIFFHRHCEEQRDEAISSVTSKSGIATSLDGLGARNDRINFYLIFGCSQDKNINYAVKHIFPLAEEVLLVKADHPRAMEPMAIYAKARKFQKNITIVGSCRRAFEYLRAKIDRGSTIIVFGSFYLWNETKLPEVR